MDNVDNTNEKVTPIRPPAGQKIDRETAALEFDRFAEIMDLDLSMVGLSSDDKADLEGAREKVVAAICRGSVVITDDGEPVFTPARSDIVDPITFYEPTGASLMAMDKVKKSADIRKTYTVLADITRKDASTFSALKIGDLKVCLAVLTLFLG